MKRRDFLAGLILAPAAAAFLAACGEERVGQPAGTDPSTVPPTTLPPGIAHPTGADELILRLGYEGGFVAPETIFLQLPSLVVTGDGRVITPGAVPAIYPGPLVSPFFVRTIDEAGIQVLLEAAKAAGLLASPPSYELPDGIGIADAPDTVLTIAANGSQYVHRAYALGMTEGSPSTPARDALSKFVTEAGDLATLVGAEHLGTDAPFQPVRYRLRATVVDPTQYSEPKPTVQAWPAGTGVVLAEATNCVLVDAADLADVVATANQLSFFTEGDVTYSLAVAAELPGDAACPAPAGA